MGESAWIPPPNDEENKSCNDEAHSSAISSEHMGVTYIFAGIQHSLIKLPWSPGSRWIRTLTILSMELKTRLHRHTISAHAKGPCTSIVSKGDSSFRALQTLANGAEVDRKPQGQKFLCTTQLLLHPPLQKRNK